MLVMLLGSFTYAQITDGDYFNFSCGPTAAEMLKSERIIELEALGDGVVTLTVTITTSNGVVDGYKSSIYNDGVFYDAYLIGTAIELQSKESFDANVSNMKSIVDGLIDDNYQAANAVRNARLDYIQTLATGNTVITVSEDPTYAGDYFNISHNGPNPPTYYNYRAIGGAYVQDISDELVPGGQGATYLSQFYDGFATWVMFAQSEYDAAALIAKRADFISQLETEFLLHETETISIELGKETANGNDADVVFIKSIDPNIFSETPITGGLLEDGEQSDIDNMKTGLPALVNIVQTNFDTAQEAIASSVSSFTGYTNDDLDDEINILVIANIGSDVRDFFTDLVGQTTSSGNTISDVIISKAWNDGDFVFLIQVYTSPSAPHVWITLPTNEYFDTLTRDQLKYHYLDLAQQAYDNL